jgi:hypothetical protein
MKKNLSFLFVLAFILLGATYAISGPLYINSQLYGEYSAISVGPSGRVDITTTTTQPSGNIITGRVTSAFFAGKTIGIAGVTIALGGSSSGTSTTDTNGYYTFSGLVDGSYTVTPSSLSYTFNPTSGPATVASNQTATVNFDASPVEGKTYSIAGNVKDKNGANLPGVTMQLQWGSTVLDDTPDLTGADGNYVIGVLADGLTYTITPIMTGKSFNPTSQNVLVNGSNVTGKNFVEQSGVPSGPLGSKTNPIPMNKGPNRGMVYFASTATQDAYTPLAANSKTWFVVDSAVAGQTISKFYFTTQGFNNVDLVYTKVVQDKAGNDLTAETALQNSSGDTQESVLNNKPYNLNSTRLLYAIENRGTTAFSLTIKVQFML